MKSFNNKEIELPITQFFTLKKPSVVRESYSKSDFGYFSTNVRGYGEDIYFDKPDFDSKSFVGRAKHAKNMLLF